ncbi:MAG: single-stranded DNA-binding protein [Thermotogae bacterium]|nr:single-stranded DNA-binding protein [Thermotogota bacterium]
MSVAGISYNRIILVGRLTRDPEVRYTTTGTQVSTFTLAVDRVRGGSSSNGEAETDFIPVVTFGRLAEFVASYLAKGRLVLVEGSLRIRRWQTQLGETRKTTEVLADAVRFMETKKSLETSVSNGSLEEHEPPIDVDLLGVEEETDTEETDEPPF